MLTHLKKFSVEDLVWKFPILTSG